MTTLTSKIDGMQLWTYDIARRPITATVNNAPQLTGYTKTNSQNDTINPVTQNPTEYLNQTVNVFRIISDVNHMSNGENVNTYGIKWALSDDPTAQNVLFTKTTSYQAHKGVMFYGDDIHIFTTGTVTSTTRKTPFTTKTNGIRIIYQTGIVSNNCGVGAVIFEVLSGYKIPVGAIIKANPKGQSDWGDIVDGTPETYQVTTEITPGIYEITLTEDKSMSWLNCDIDFATIQDKTPTPATTTPTTTTPQPKPSEPATTTPAQPTVTTQLDVLKNSLRIPSDLKDDDKLLQSYIDGATEYLRSTIDSDEDVVSKLNSKRAQVVINALAELMYENRGSDKVAKGFPYTLQVLINQLRFA